MKMTVSFSATLPKCRLRNTDISDICTGPCVCVLHCPGNTLDSVNTVLVTCLSMQAFIHSPIRYSDDPAVLQTQSFEQRTQR